MNPIVTAILSQLAERAGPNLADSRFRPIAALGRGLNRVNEWDQRANDWARGIFERALGVGGRGAGDYSSNIARQTQQYLDSRNFDPSRAAMDIANRTQAGLDDRVNWQSNDRLADQQREEDMRQQSNRPEAMPSRGIGTRGGEVIAQRTGDVRGDRALESLAEGLLGRSATQSMSRSAQQARNAMIEMFGNSER